MKKGFDFSIEDMQQQQQLPEIFCKHKKIDWKKILYCEAKGSYTWIKFENNMQIKQSERIGLVSKKLPKKYFNRCHDKYTVNLKKVKIIKLDKPIGVFLENELFIPI